MADVFISYKREDGALAKLIADAVRRENFTVFFDVNVPVGDAWDEKIESELSQAKAVIVLWSSRSVTSRWVRNEARFADEARLLFPAIIDECRPPVEFAHLQCASLVRWNGDQMDAELRRLISRVSSKIQNTSGERAYAPASIESGDELRRIWCEVLSRRADRLERDAPLVSVPVPPWWILNDVRGVLAVSVGLAWSIIGWPLAIISMPIWGPFVLINRAHERKRDLESAVKLRLRGESGSFPRSLSEFWYELQHRHLTGLTDGERNYRNSIFARIVVAAKNPGFPDVDSVSRAVEAIGEEIVKRTRLRWTKAYAFT